MISICNLQECVKIKQDNANKTTCHIKKIANSKLKMCVYILHIFLKDFIGVYLG